MMKGIMQILMPLSVAKTNMALTYLLGNKENSSKFG